MSNQLDYLNDPVYSYDRNFLASRLCVLSEMMYEARKESTAAGYVEWLRKDYLAVAKRLKEREGGQ